MSGDQNPWKELGDKLLDKIPDIRESLAKLYNAVWYLYEPTHIRRIGKANREVRRADRLDSARTDYLEEGFRMGELQPSDLDKDANLLITPEERRRRNAKAVVSQGMDFLPEATNLFPPNAASERLEEDWLYRFLGDCEDIGNEQMQSLYAKILAGEIVKPGSFSLQTLAVVRVLQQRDAELFTKFCGYVWKVAGKLCIPLSQEKEGEPLPGLSPLEITHLDSLGLTNGGAKVQLKMWASESSPSTAASYRSEYEMSVLGNTRLEIDLLRILPRSGCELYPISGCKKSYEYESLVIREWEKSPFLRIKKID